MKKNLFLFCTVPAAALLLAGCCGSRHTAGLSPPAQGGSAASETGIAVIAETGGEPVALAEVAAIPATVAAVTETAAETVQEGEIALHKEELVVGKKEVSNGGVLIRTVVQTENVSQPVELRREEYVIERIPASELKNWEAKGVTPFQGREIYVPLTREEPVAAIRPLLTESVQLVKKTETDHVTVSHPVRSEDLAITKVAAPAASALGIVSGPAAAAARNEADLNQLQLTREELVVGKRNIENGGVRLVKVINTQEASQPLDVQRQEFAVNRTALGDKPAEITDFSPREMKMSLTREEPVAGTRSYLAEVVRVRKQIHTDTQTVAAQVRRENVEIVKLTPEQMGMGGTGVSSQSGAAVVSESGFTPAKTTTITGKIACAKCQLHQTDTCQTVIQVQNGDQAETYYLVENEVSSSSVNLCKINKKVTATGTVQEVAGKRLFTATNIEPAK